MNFTKTICHRRFSAHAPSSLINPGPQKTEFEACIGPQCAIFVPMVDPQTNRVIDGKCADIITAVSLNQLVSLKAQEISNEKEDVIPTPEASNNG